MNEIAIKQAIAGARLTVEPVPDTCLITRLRDHVAPAAWDLISRRTAADADRRCRLCDTLDARRPLECAEVWDFDGVRRQITLIGPATLCVPCFRARSIGRGDGGDAVQLAVFQIAKVNGWTETLARFYVNVCFRVWDTRSQYDWVMDLSYIKINFQIQITPPKEAE